MESTNTKSTNFSIDDTNFQHPGNTSSFDLVLWIFRILKYWYLFLVVILLSLSLALLKNKTWTPTYKTSSTILINENKGQQVSDLTTGFAVSQGLRNVNNQMIMYGSYDLISKSVDKLDISTDIYHKGLLKSVSYYKASPILIKSNFISEEAASLDFRIRGIDTTAYEITFDGAKNIAPFSIVGNYGTSLQHNLFFVTVDKTDQFPHTVKYELNFNFLSRGQQIADYNNRLNCSFLLDGASVMEISLVGKVTQRDIDFLKILNQEFFDDNLKRKNATAERAIEFINEQLLILKDSISSAESKLNAYQSQAGIFSSDNSLRSSTELVDLDKKKAEIRLRKEYTKFLQDNLKKEDGNLVPPSSMGIQDVELAVLVSKYNDIFFEIKGLGSENPIYKRYKLQLTDIKSSINQSIVSMKNSIGIEEADLNQRYSKLSAEVASLPDKERKLLTHERDFKINDSYNTYLLQRRIESQIQLASNMPDNLVLDNARTTGLVNAGDISNTYVYFVVTGLILTIIFIFLKEVLLKTSIQSRSEVEKISELPILGTIEHTERKEMMVLYKYPKSSFAENFRHLRSRMIYLTKRDSPIVMLITSTEPRDGKTFVACNLASAYQMTGKKTLMIDFDLRRPALSKALDLDTQKGLSNFLIGKASLADVVISHPDFGFDILPAGTIPPNPSELINSEMTKKLLSFLSKEYEYIILDCSPVGLVSDAHFLAKLADVVLYVVRNEKTNRNFFKHTISEFKGDVTSGKMAIIYNDVDLDGNYYASRNYYGKSSYYHKHNSYYNNDEFVDEQNQN
ncbi:colanic acid production tyrosine-protein kinase [Bacteroidales bacterium]|nr:colanic acid production tyrosine-protein kinase [Bacteroidales bacterium]